MVSAYGGYGSITLNDVPLFTTGDPWNGPPENRPAQPVTNWPCWSTRAQACGTGSPGLFCDLAHCFDINERSRLNNRMLGAVMALRAPPSQASGTDAVARSNHALR